MHPILYGIEILTKGKWGLKREKRQRQRIEKLHKQWCLFLCESSKSREH